jgi:hypothetical protein
MEQECKSSCLLSHRLELISNYQSVDVYPNDQKAKFHFAIKSKDGQTMYAWHRAKDEGDLEFELHERFLNVEITQKDSRGLQWTFIYLIENESMPEAPEKKYNDNAPVVF